MSFGARHGVSPTTAACMSPTLNNGDINSGTSPAAANSAMDTGMVATANSTTIEMSSVAATSQEPLLQQPMVAEPAETEPEPAAGDASQLLFERVLKSSLGQPRARKPPVRRSKPRRPTLASITTTTKSAADATSGTPELGRAQSLPYPLVETRAHSQAGLLALAPAAEPVSFQAHDEQQLNSARVAGGVSGTLSPAEATATIVADAISTAVDASAPVDDHSHALSASASNSMPADVGTACAATTATDTIAFAGNAPVLPDIDGATPSDNTIDTGHKALGLEATPVSRPRDVNFSTTGSPMALESQTDVVATTTADTDAIPNKVTPIPTRTNSTIPTTTLPKRFGRATSKPTVSSIITNGNKISQAAQKFERPELSYMELIVEAIQSTPLKMLSLQEIYDSIKQRYEYFQHAPPTWQNSIRHNLSVQKLFEKKPRPDTQPGKGGLWTISDHVRMRRTSSRISVLSAPGSSAKHGGGMRESGRHTSSKRKRMDSRDRMAAAETTHTYETDEYIPLRRTDSFSAIQTSHTGAMHAPSHSMNSDGMYMHDPIQPSPGLARSMSVPGHITHPGCRASMMGNNVHGDAMATSQHHRHEGYASDASYNPYIPFQGRSFRDLLDEDEDDDEDEDTLMFNNESDSPGTILQNGYNAAYASDWHEMEAQRKHRVAAYAESFNGLLGSGYGMVNAGPNPAVSGVVCPNSAAEAAEMANRATPGFHDGSHSFIGLSLLENNSDACGDMPFLVTSASTDDTLEGYQLEYLGSPFPKGAPTVSDFPLDMWQHNSAAMGAGYAPPYSAPFDHSLAMGHHPNHHYQHQYHHGVNLMQPNRFSQHAIGGQHMVFPPTVMVTHDPTGSSLGSPAIQSAMEYETHQNRNVGNCNNMNSGDANGNPSNVNTNDMGGDGGVPANGNHTNNSPFMARLPPAPASTSAFSHLIDPNLQQKTLLEATACTVPGTNGSITSATRAGSPCLLSTDQQSNAFMLSDIDGMVSTPMRTPSIILRTEEDCDLATMLAY